MKTSIIRKSLLFMLLVSSLYAFTSNDYYQAALKLYNAKNYVQATQYFSAAISLDPNNAAALQGRANCYYVQGQYQQALADYQKVLSLNPSNTQLSQFIQSLQAKVGTSPAPATGSISSPQPGEAFNQGVALYQQRQYAAAVPYFQKAVQENPNDSKAYYYLGATQMMLGDTKDAAVALGLSNKLSPNPGIAGYVTQLKARLSPEDQQWVDSQINSGAAPKSAVAAKPKSFGLRLEPAITLLNMNDFEDDATTNEALTKFAQSSDPSVAFGFNGTVPVGTLNLGLEPVVRLGSNFEIGLPFAIVPVGTASGAITDSSGDSLNDSFQISAFSIGLNVRYLFGNGDFVPFLGAGGMIVPISIAYSGNGTLSGSGSASYSGTFNGTAAGGQVQLGLDWHLGDTFVVSPFVGYQFVTANSFQGTLNSTNTGGPASQSAELDVIPTDFGNTIRPTSNGKMAVPAIENQTTVLNAGDPTPSGTRPLEVDLSGITGGLQVSAFF